MVLDPLLFFTFGALVFFSMIHVFFMFWREMIGEKT